ncbi:hypothetical protein FDECE_4390 [Fusarium decemcellulare]|nr:hypothetical protein FDECE_4390 [Fusarium decemcellulare]
MPPWRHRHITCGVLEVASVSAGDRTPWAARGLPEAKALSKRHRHSGPSIAAMEALICCWVGKDSELRYVGEDDDVFSPKPAQSAEAFDSADARPRGDLKGPRPETWGCRLLALLSPGPLTPWATEASGVSRDASTAPPNRLTTPASNSPENGSMRRRNTTLLDAQASLMNDSAGSLKNASRANKFDHGRKGWPKRWQRWKTRGHLTTFEPLRTPAYGQSRGETVGGNIYNGILEGREGRRDQRRCWGSPF